MRASDTSELVASHLEMRKNVAQRYVKTENPQTATAIVKKNSLML